MSKGGIGQNILREMKEDFHEEIPVPKIKELLNEVKTKMSKEITLTREELEKEINQAFIHGQGNGTMMEAGLERDETEDYVNSRMRSLLNQNKDE